MKKNEELAMASDRREFLRMAGLGAAALTAGAGSSGGAAAVTNTTSQESARAAPGRLELVEDGKRNCRFHSCPHRKPSA